MKSFNFVSILLLGFVWNATAHSGPICKSVPECQGMIQQASIRIQILTGTPDKRITTTGAIFTRDTSNPALGEAYRDPSGMIWGDKVTVMMSHHDAGEYCKARGARLPSNEDILRLEKYFGSGTPYYSDQYYDANNEYSSFLPHLSSTWFWSSTISPYNPYSAYAWFIDWEDSFIIRDLTYMYAVRCVAD